jgi:hypothetical protein
MVHFTQKELANRWKRAESAIINMRRRGDIPYILLPGSNKYLYSMSDIIELDAPHKRTAKEVVGKTRIS